jgi:hypothetical protein
MTSSPTNQPKPVVFIAFANEQEGKRYLRELPGEARELRAALQKAEDRGLCEVEVRTNATFPEVVEIFNRHGRRVVIFHYAGHAGPDCLLLESSTGAARVAHAGGLAQFLGPQGAQGGLQLASSYLVAAEGDLWTLRAGAVHGLPAATGAGAEALELALYAFDATPEHLRDRSRALGKARVVAVGPTSCRVELEGVAGPPRDAIFKAVITRLPLPVLAARLEGDADAVALAREVLGQAGPDHTASLFVREAKEGEPPEYRLIARGHHVERGDASLLEQRNDVVGGPGVDERRLPSGDRIRIESPWSTSRKSMTRLPVLVAACSWAGPAFGARASPRAAMTGARRLTA